MWLSFNKFDSSPLKPSWHIKKKLKVHEHLKFPENYLKKMEKIDIDTQTWQRKRKWMFINQCIGALAYGLSLNIYFPTEYYYLKDTVQVKNPDLFFGLARASLYLSGVVSSVIGSYYADYTKNVREICLTEDVLNVIGNLMYTLYYSPYLILFGQLLIGTTSARMASSVGEISRVYETDKITQKLGIVGLMTMTGSVIGPCTTFFFQYIDISIGNWKWNIGNMTGISMTVFYLFQLGLNYFTLDNVSKEHTLKRCFSVNTVVKNPETLESNCIENATETTPLTIKSRYRRSFNQKYVTSLRIILKNKHIVFCLAMAVIQNYARGLIKIVVPIKAEEYLKWKQTDIAKLLVVAIAVGSIPTMILISVLTKCVNDFFLYLGSFIFLVLSLLLAGLLPMFREHEKKTELMFYCAAIFFYVSTSIFHIMSRAMLAKFVPENIQSITQGFRNALYEMAILLSGLSVMLPATYLSETMFAMLVIISVSLAWYIAEERTYRNIKVTGTNSENISTRFANETRF